MNLFISQPVILAQAGIQSAKGLLMNLFISQPVIPAQVCARGKQRTGFGGRIEWTPAFAGVTR